MAGLPPDTIHVKRKRGADDPVDFLRLERSKRYRSLSGDGWIYQRKENALLARATDSVSGPPTGPPTIQATQEGEERRPIKRASASRLSRAATPTDTTTTSPEVPPTTATSMTTERVRRFHLTRSASPQPSAGVSKKRTAPAVFIERDAKKQRESLKAIVKQHNVAPTTAQPKPPSDSQPTKEQPPKTEQAPAAAPAKLKRPGTRALSKPPPAAPPSSTPPASSTQPPPSSTQSPPSSTQPLPSNLPPSMQRRPRDSTPSRQDVDELARQMDSWTLDLIAANEAATAARDARANYSPAPATKTAKPSRFKPKAPKQRWFERHPEAAAAAASTGKGGVEGGGGGGGGEVVGAAAGSGGDDTTDEEDYVLETYERVPAARLRVEAVPAHRVGLLVFDTEPEMAEFFYGNESDEEDEFPEDEEDENAENYYANEYPDEDLDWDDEFDRNPYSYLNPNASDMEEFDERDFSGDRDLEEATVDKLTAQWEKLRFHDEDE